MRSVSTTVTPRIDAEITLEYGVQISTQRRLKEASQEGKKKLTSAHKQVQYRFAREPKLWLNGR